jgi:hypothetical protein
MPIPKRSKGTPKDEYINSCIRKLVKEYPLKQAAAICYSEAKRK